MTYSQSEAGLFKKRLAVRNFAAKVFSSVPKELKTRRLVGRKMEAKLMFNIFSRGRFAPVSRNDFSFIIFHEIPGRS